MNLEKMNGDKWFLVNKDFKDKLDTLQTEMRKGLTTRHSKGQIVYGILGDKEFKTPDHKYWQGKLEVSVRIDNLFLSHYQYKKNYYQLLKNEVEIERLQEIANRDELKQIEIKELENENDLLKKKLESEKFNVSEIIREIKHFLEYMKKLEPDVKYTNRDDAWTDWVMRRMNA